jgi:hypothetical protein
MNWNKTWAAAAFAGALTASAPHAMAMQDTTVFMPGVDIGTPTAALPPPGVYSTTGFEYFNYPLTNGQGNHFGPFVHDYNAGEQILFVPQLPTFFGANYAAFVIQPFRGIDVTGLPPFAAPNGTAGRVGLENTVWSPLNLSWNFHNGWFFGVGFEFYSPTGTYNVNDPIHISRRYWSFEPSASVGYIDKDWIANLHVLYNTSTTNNIYAPFGSTSGAPFGAYHSGDELVIDAFFERKFGKFDLGVGESYTIQTTNDTFNGSSTPAALCGGPANCSYGNKISLFGIGPTAAYHWNEVTIAGTVLFEPKGLINVNGTQGVRWYTSISTPIWQPEKAPVVTAKY